jgi:cupin fold WbuC family metalloprotein
MSMTVVDQRALADLMQKAKAAPRRRSHLLLHRDHDDQVQRLVILLGTGTYVRPHQHSEQWEMLALIRGRADFLMFTEDGELMERVELGADRVGVVEIPPGQVHGCVAIDDGTAVLEIKPGPYRPNEFMPWAPAEGVPDADRFVAWALAARAGTLWNWGKF